MLQYLTVCSLTFIQSEDSMCVTSLYTLHERNCGVLDNSNYVQSNVQTVCNKPGTEYCNLIGGLEILNQIWFMLKEW